MRIVDDRGHGVELRVEGYQFPDAPDPGLRRSWLVITGSGRSERGGWDFGWPALTPPDAVFLGGWLLASANGDDAVERAWFTEPNLAFERGAVHDDAVTLTIEVDLEYTPPWHRRTRAGDPYRWEVAVPRESLRSAAREWAAELEPYPG